MQNEINELVPMLVCTQPPVISENLMDLQERVSLITDMVNQLPKEPDSVPQVKKARADLRKYFDSLEEQRKAVKAAVMAPYNEAEAKYKAMVSGPIQQADKLCKDFVDGVLPTPEEICKKQLFKTMDDIMKTDVDEDQIKPYMAEINRQFEYIDKEDIIKKMVTITFGKFLDYYKNAPEIIKPETGKGSRGGEGRGSRGEGCGKVSNGRWKHETEAGFKRLFINLGKADGFYPGEIMQYLNKHVKGRQEVGHIDLLSKFAYIEVPEEDAKRVMKALNGTEYKGRTVRCNDADEEGHGRAARGGRSSEGRGGRSSERGGRSRRGSSDDARDSRDARGKGGRGSRGESRGGRKSRSQEDTGDWRQFFQNNDNVKFKGEEPNFEEEGWARRRPKKK